jgi:radical SAM protein with 4Fe4S-binding SPASM domain
MQALLYRLLLKHYKTPQYLILFVNRNCWCKCAHCWYNETWKEKHLPREDLTFAELEKIADSVDQLRFLSLTGGEAFGRSDIVEIAHMFALKIKLKRYQIPTSGFNTDLVLTKTEKLLAENSNIPFRVDVSLDGTETTHDHIRANRGSYAHAINTIKALNAIKKRCSFFDVGVITTISGENQQEIAAISRIVETINPFGEWMVNIVRGDPRDSAVKTVALENYTLAHNLIEERINNKKYSGHSGHRFASWLSAKNAVRRKVIINVLQGKHKSGNCAAGILGGVIYNDGSVYPCETLDDSFGNVKDYDCNLEKTWNSSKASALRTLIQTQKCMCTQECFLSINLATQPNYWPGIIKERIRLLL